MQYGATLHLCIFCVFAAVALDHRFLVSVSDTIRIIGIALKDSTVPVHVQGTISRFRWTDSTLETELDKRIIVARRATD